MFMSYLMVTILLIFGYSRPFDTPDELHPVAYEAVYNYFAHDVNTDISPEKNMLQQL